MNRSVMYLNLECVQRLCPLRCFSMSPTLHLNQKWRQDRGLPLNPNACGVLTDSPDYSFLDGRPAPYGMGQRKRMLLQQELASQIIKLTGEIDFAVARHIRLKEEEALEKQKILDSKLKEKGMKLLKKD